MHLWLRWMGELRGCRDRRRCAFLKCCLWHSPWTGWWGGGYNLTWQFSWVISVLLTSRSDLLNAHGLGMHDYSYGGLRKYSRRCMASGNIRCHVLVQQEVDTSTFASTETGVGVSGSQEFWEAGLQLQVRSW